MGFVQDISPIFNKRDIVLIERYQEAHHVYTFVFEKETNLNWKAGQHGVFSIIHKKIKKPIRPFSITSAPFENVIKITIGISDTPSEFKKAMLELQPGMKINMRGPIGPLYINHETPSLLIAGGIGITPFRSILKEAEKDNKPIHLLYIDSKESFLYAKEFDEIVKNTSIKVSYFNSREDLYKEIDTFIAQNENSGMYYLGGARSMVKAVAGYLKNRRVSKRHIKKDIFIGL